MEREEIRIEGKGENRREWKEKRRDKDGRGKKERYRGADWWKG